MASEPQRAVSTLPDYVTLSIGKAAEVLRNLLLKRLEKRVMFRENYPDFNLHAGHEAYLRKALTLLDRAVHPEWGATALFFQNATARIPTIQDAVNSGFRQVVVRAMIDDGTLRPANTLKAGGYKLTEQGEVLAKAGEVSKKEGIKADDLMAEAAALIIMQTSADDSSIAHQLDLEVVRACCDVIQAFKEAHPHPWRPPTPEEQEETPS